MVTPLEEAIVFFFIPFFIHIRCILTNYDLWFMKIWLYGHISQGIVFYWSYFCIPWLSCSCHVCSLLNAWICVQVLVCVSVCVCFNKSSCESRIYPIWRKHQNKLSFQLQHKQMVSFYSHLSSNLMDTIKRLFLMNVCFFW